MLYSRSVRTHKKKPTLEWFFTLQMNKEKALPKELLIWSSSKFNQQQKLQQVSRQSNKQKKKLSSKTQFYSGAWSTNGSLWPRGTAQSCRAGSSRSRGSGPAQLPLCKGFGCLHRVPRAGKKIALKVFTICFFPIHTKCKIKPKKTKAWSLWSQNHLHRVQELSRKDVKMYFVIKSC